MVIFVEADIEDGIQPALSGRNPRLTFARLGRDRLHPQLGHLRHRLAVAGDPHTGSPACDGEARSAGMGEAELAAAVRTHRSRSP